MLNLVDQRTQQTEHEIDASFSSSSPTPAEKPLFPAPSDLLRSSQGVHQLPGEKALLFRPFPIASDHVSASPKSDEKN
jgi:hypothetical protein